MCQRNTCPLVLFALLYSVVGRLLSLIVVRGRGEASKDVELVVLRHEISVLRRQLPRPRLAPADRLIMAAFARHLPASLRKFRVVSPSTLLRWHRELMARKWTYPRKVATLGRPTTRKAVRELVLRLARENPTWGHRQVHGEMVTLGYTVSASTVWNIVTGAGMDRSGAATVRADVAGVLPGAGSQHARLRLLPCRHRAVAPGLRILRHRGRYPRSPRPWCDRSSHRCLGHPAGAQSDARARRCRAPGEVLDP